MKSFILQNEIEKNSLHLKEKVFIFQLLIYILIID